VNRTVNQPEPTRYSEEPTAVRTTILRTLAESKNKSRNLAVAIHVFVLLTCFRGGAPSTVSPARFIQVWLLTKDHRLNGDENLE
jgi:hypothetical protein